MKSQRTIFFPGVFLVLLGVVPALSVGSEGPNSLWAYRAAYWDGRYPSTWAGGGEAVRDTLEYAGYEILDANRLKAWMDARIADGLPSVVVFCRDIAPDTVAESMSFRCTLRRYLDAGGKIVWYADIPMYYQGHTDGTRTAWGVDGAINILGFNAAEGAWNSQTEVVFTADGMRWGLTETWQSQRPTSGYGLRVLARDADGYAAAWVKHYVPGDTYRGFVRLSDRPGEPNLNDLRAVAEYPHVPDPIVFDNQAESQDDIVGVFFYPWYENPNTSSRWRHWNGSGYSPPATWAACYLPNYPDSTWNPSVQLYDSKDTEVLRWQDRAMARAGVDIAVASWWGIGGYEDAGLAKAIRTCKSVQWCIYYEMEAYGDPTVQRIHDDIKYVLDTYGPTRNYARIDGKWLVLVYGAGGDETASRWRQAKALLAAHGYDVYLNGDKSNAREPWDAVHSYHPVVYQGYTHALPDVDDSAWIAPGFCGIADQSPRLERSLSEFASAWNNIVANRNRCRFILVETWNEWHEGTQIESGREIIRDRQGFRPKPDGDYGYTFIDTIAPAAVNNLHWTSSGHRPIVPARLEAENIIWDDDSKVSLSQAPNKVLIAEKDVRIGSSILVPQTPDSNQVVFTIRANALANRTASVPVYPRMTLYIDDAGVAQWEVLGKVPQLGLERADRDYLAVVPLEKGIHRVELAMTYEVGNWDLIVDFIDVNATFTESPGPEGPSSEDFETGGFAGSGEQDWTQVSFPVTAGRRTFRWEYSKDGSASIGDDTAWIDDIIFPVK